MYILNDAQFDSEISLIMMKIKNRKKQQNGKWADIQPLSDELTLNLADSQYLKGTMISVIPTAYADEIIQFHKINKKG